MTKLVSGRLKAQPVAGPHPGPELLAAFAGNALPEADRGQLLQHLGACSDCREILFLALPDSTEAQKVLVLQPRPFRRWRLTWGALVASIAIAAVVFTSNRLGHKNQAATIVATLPANPPETKIAAEKTPPELDQMRNVQDASKAKVASTLAIENKLQPDAKQMTAKLQPELEFETSGEVHERAWEESTNLMGPLGGKDEREKQTLGIAVLNGAATQTGSAGKPGAYDFPTPAPSKSRADQQAAAGQQAAVQADAVSASNSEQADARNALPKAPAGVEDRSALNGMAAFHGNATPTGSPQPTGGSAQDKNATAYAYSRPGLLPMESAAKGNLGGIVSDPSGAVVANAKVTVIGPNGTQTVTSDPGGRFVFGRVPPGLYSIKAAANGFKTTEMKQVAVLDDSTSALRLTLDVGTVSETVEISAAAPAATEAAATVAPVLKSSNVFVGEQMEADAKLSRKKAAAANTRQKGIGAGAGMPVLQWTLSPEGAVHRSDDSGRTWQSVSVATGATFRALSAVGANIWVGGNAGALYRSTDSGKAWAKVEPAAGGKKLDQDVAHVDFMDALSGTVNTANGEVWTTSDGGQSWQRK